MLAVPATATNPGENGKIVFMSDKTGDREVYVMNADGTGVQNLTNNPSRNDDGPAWSPDGTKIAWTVSSPCCELWVMNLDGTGKRLIAATGAQASWSPNGKQIVFQGFKGGRIEIAVMNSAGGKSRRIAKDGSPENPVWSPDGSKIAFIRSVAGLNSLWVMNRNGKNKRMLTSGPGVDSPDWSPDGKKILFDRGNGKKTRIYVINANGKQEKKLTREPIRAENATYAPDGSKIIYSRGATNAKSRLYVMNPNGKGPKQKLSAGGLPCFQPSWQPLP